MTARLLLALVLVLSFLALGPLQTASSQVPIARQDTLLNGNRTPIAALPFTIDRCGSYFLTDCLTGVAGQHGITIDADDVTLDLNGFTLLGVPGSLDGVHADPARQNLNVFGGSVSQWGGAGLEAGSAASIRDLRAFSNAGAGISALTGSRAEGCVAQGNQGDGIAMGFNCAVVDCVAVGNQGNGIHLAIAATATGGTVIGCSLRGNAQAGVFAGDGCIVQSCSATFNGTGIAVGVGSVIAGCSAVLNSGDGIATFGSLVRGNSAQNSAGAQINAPGSTLIENH